ncbi:MAG: peptidase domain-containing ABC transporter, partial [Runella slithyformis]
KVTLQKLLEEAPLPCIVHWGQNHFVVVAPNPQRESFSPFSFKRRRGQGVEVADPAAGLLTYTLQEFESRWATTVNEEGQKVGIALLLEAPPAPGGGAIDFDENKNRKVGLRLLWGQVWRYRGLLFQVGLGLLAGSLLQLMLPFLTKSVVDVGIQTRNLQFVYLVLGAQLALMIGRMSVEFIRSWILLHISTRVNLSILSNFLAKLLRLPIAYFEAKTTGDIMQRIGDHRRIEQFLTGTSLNVLFSMFNLVVFSFVLAYYSLPIFGVFMAGSALYAVWIMLFLKRRRVLDHKQFALGAQSQNNLMQLIASVPELKLNNAELKKRWEWENIQVCDFKLSMKGLALQYIIGQLNSPVEQLIQFVQHWQDAQISLERLNEVNTLNDESSPPAPDGGTIFTPPSGVGGLGLLLQNLTFTYAGAGNEPVLKNINLHIPQGKTTAIVGSSGSGKTTLLKLLLRFYEPQIGNIDLTPAPLLKTGEGLRQWRKKCGTVLQDGFIFSDTIANNIAISDETTDFGKVMNAIQVANLQDFIISLPLGLNTKIGIEGNGISQGQRQRILIARAVYKNPEYLFFDEATNALDTENEAIIMKNLAAFSQNKTVVVVAHRLSTVKNADQIVVLEKGEIVEIGTHYELAAKRGRYFELVSNQLELAP